MSELWKELKEFPMYEVSDMGRVRSYKNPTPKILKHSVDKTGRCHVGLRKNGITRTKRVHQLVLSAFISPRPENHQGCHNDGNPSNNKLSNLRWDTSSSNQLDRIKHGTSPQGSRHGMSKLCEKDVEIIRGLILKGKTESSVSKMFRVSRQTVNRIKARKTWRHI